MIDEISVTPEELYYLGKILKAKYIDYDYIKAMGDIGQASAVAKQKAYDELGKKHYIEEDFMGEISVDSDVKTVLMPLFFGNFESSLDVAEIGDKAEVYTYRLHKNEDGLSLSVFTDHGINIRVFSDDLLRNLIVSLLPANYFDKELSPGTTVEREKITRAFAFKNNSIGEKTEIKVFYECGEQIYFLENGKASVLSGDYFCEEAFRILGGTDSGVHK